MASRVAVVEFGNYTASVTAAFDTVGAAGVLERQKRIILKPNIVNDTPHPVTTSPACVEAVIAYCRMHSRAEIAIAEGCGGMDTARAFKTLGYTELSMRVSVPLVDLDNEETVQLPNPAFQYLKEFPLPRCLEDSFLISIPVLKAHSMSDVTLTMKNMFGIAPAWRYAGSYYRKSKLHGRNNHELHQYVVELNQYRHPDLTLLDATIGMAESHLSGRQCSPPVNKLVAGFDPVAVDAFCAGLLGFRWQDIGHIQLANGLLGNAEAEMVYA